MSLKLSTRKSSGVSIVDISGRVTLGETASALRETIGQMARSGERQILLNLSDLGYLDSSGMGVLVSSFATINSLGGRLKLTNLSDRVKDLLLITKLYTVFEIFEDESSAVASFAAAAVAGPRSGA